MFIRDLNDCPLFVAGDYTLLRELLHPDKADLELRYSLAHATLHPGKSSQLHSLRTSEVYYIIRGEGMMHIGEEQSMVYPGQVVYIPPEKKQFIVNTGNEDLVFLCIVDPAWRREDEQVF